MHLSFEGKKVLVTGGSRGIGASCVKMFFEAGAEVAFTYARDEKATIELIKALDEKKVKAFKANFLNEREIIECAERILANFGGIDILINNAGIWTYGDIENMTLETWDETIKVNLTSSFLFTKFFVAGMKRKKYGKIIFVSSTAGQRGEAFHSHYAATKGAMISFAKSLASELGEYNINVNCVAPGWVYTDMNNEVFSDKKFVDKILEGIPLKRIATPDEIAAPILFIASDYARHITGEVLNINGGSVLCG